MWRQGKNSAVVFPLVAKIVRYRRPHVHRCQQQCQLVKCLQASLHEVSAALKRVEYVFLWGYL